MDRPFYHEGMRALQDRFDGRRVADRLVEKRLHDEFWDDERQMIEQAPCFFIATAHDGYVDCNIKSGNPGFVQIVGPNVLEYPEYDGNSMYRTLGNIAQSADVGLLFVRFDGQSRRIRINGKASLHDDPATLARDLRELQEKFTIESVTPLDMFPQTAEIEVAVHLQAISFAN